MSFGFGVGDFLAVLQLANDVRKKISDAPEEFKVLDAEVRTLSITLQDTDIWLYNASTQQQNAAEIVLEDCLTLLSELQKALNKFAGLRLHQNVEGKEETSHKFKRWWTSIKWDPEEIKGFQLRIISNITKLTSIGQERMQADVDCLVAHKDHQQRSEVLEWISPQVYTKKQHDVLSKRVDSSASQWLLESKKFSTWLADTGKTLFCPGIPGAGKTMTTAIVVDRLISMQKTHALTAYVYCTYQNQEQQSHDQIVASILRSLVEQLSKPPEGILESFETQGKLGRPITAQQIFSAVKSISASADRVNVLIDALDELPGEVRDDLITTMMRLQKEVGLSLFLTSRHNVGIEAKVYPDPDLTVEIRAASEDVKKYLHANLSRLPHCVYGKDKLQVLIVQSITEVVDGMFLLAELHMDSLKNKKFPRQIRTALTKLSSGSNAYNEAYEEAWKRLDAQPEEHRNLARQTIAILLTARRPLSVEELRHALSVDTEDEQVDDEEDMLNIEDILATCVGLVTADPASNVVRLVHKSAQDYFSRHRAEHLPDAEAFIGKLCVIYRDAKGSEPQSAPFYDYADKNWWFHLNQATENQELGKAGLEPESTHGLRKSKLAAELGVQLGIETFGSDPSLYQTILGACKSGNQGFLEALLDTTRFDLAGNTELLSLAVEKRHEDIVKLLLGRGAKPNSPGRKQRPVIFSAIDLDASAIVQVILDFKGDLEYCGGLKGETPLLWAAAQGSLSCLKLLLRVANTAATDSTGKGVLSVAICHHRAAVVETLLQRPEVDVTLCDGQDISPLRHAVHEGQHHVVETLLKNPEVDVSIRDGANEAILYEAVERDHLEVVRALLSCGLVTRNSRRLRDGFSLIHCAVRGNEHLPRLFFKQSEDLPIRESDFPGVPSSTILKLLLESGLVDVNAVDGDGMTALHHVCMLRPEYSAALEGIDSWWADDTYIDQVRGDMLVELCSTPGINLDLIDHGGETALYKAVHVGNAAHIKGLTARGASVNVKGAKQIPDTSHTRCGKDPVVQDPYDFE